MMRYLVCIIVGLTLMAAGCADEQPSPCLDMRIDAFKKMNADRAFTGIYSFEQDGSTYYIFDSGIAFDATAEVVNSDCEVVCIYGGLRMSGDQDERCLTYQNGINSAVAEWEGG